MPSRLNKRVQVNFWAEITTGNATYPGLVGNLSKEGACIKKLATQEQVNLEPGKELHMKFSPPDAESLNLSCEVVWAKVNPSNNVLEGCGMKIIASSSEYDEFFESLL